MFRAPASNGGSRPRVLFLGSYPPRECGIATFTEDIRGAYDLLTGSPSDVIAVTDDERSYAYPPCVVTEIHRDDRRSYLEAARFANNHAADVVNIQHEYGLFGGERGDYLLDLLSALSKPVVITLHTTLPKPDDRMRFVTAELEAAELPGRVHLVTALHACDTATDDALALAIAHGADHGP